MGYFIINGAKPLSGSVNIGGSKNAALPIIFSCIAIKGVSIIENLPDIGDVNVALDILAALGAKIERNGACLRIDTRELTYKHINEELVSGIRASSYLIGASLSRFGKAELQRFGGCNFDSRPIDMHIKAAEAFGARLDGSLLTAKALHGCEIKFPKISVGATVNALIMAAGARGESRIYGYAKEPHVISLAEFLENAGAKIEITDEYISVRGSELGSSSAVIIPDMIEAGTYLAISLMTDSNLCVSGAESSHLDSFLHALAGLGSVVEFSGNTITANPCNIEYSSIKTAPYPAFPTDLQPQMAPLLAKGEGGIITEGVWHNRFGYLDSLSEFGIKYKIFDGCASIMKSDIHSGHSSATDLRGGAALIMAALFAKGESVVGNSEIIKRGYTDIEWKLRSIGAEIKEVT